jgi:hypothetical protein
MEIQRCSPSAILGFRRAYDSVMGEVLHNSVIGCHFNMKLVILTKIGLNKSCKIIWEDKHKFVVFPIGML